MTGVLIKRVVLDIDTHIQGEHHVDIKIVIKKDLFHILFS